MVINRLANHATKPGHLRLLLPMLLLLAWVGACGNKEHAELIGDATNRPQSTTPRPLRSSVPVVPALDASPAEDAADAQSSLGDAQAVIAGNCGDLVCRGHGRCLEKDGTASCVCDQGYIPEGQDANYECVVDKSCKRLHMLQETGCIQLVNSAPAVAMFFAVDYCAGTAVLPEDLGDLSQAFRILENGKDLSDESIATVIERDVESYITIALDISKSVTGGANDPVKRARLTAITSQLRDFVGSLKAADGAPPVSVSIQVFGRFVSEYVPFTNDLSKIDDALAQLQEAPDSVVETVSAQGTALFEATKRGIQAVERIQRLRGVVSEGGVLSSGTLVVVTDGADTVGAKLDTALLTKTLVNVISVGISSDIDDASLSAIGRDGSFLAPTEDDWITSFDEIAERVRQYPERAYLLAYCTSLSNGKPNVSVSLRDEVPNMVASCSFNADTFSKDPIVASSCTLEFFDHYCDAVECGTMFACGACDEAACCSAGKCMAPENASDCRDQDALCGVGDQTCYKIGDDAFECREAPAAGEECGERNTCAKGSYCSGGQCLAVELENGDTCGVKGDLDGARCPEGNCAQESPTIDNYICKGQARANDVCGGGTADAKCEPGTSCRSNVCVERSVFAACNSDDQCGSGICDTLAHVCISPGACYFDWNSILNP
jgi:von Willebrand factor type A domain